MSQVDNQPQTFSAEFNGAISKVYRLNYLLNKSHEARVSDNHVQWKTILDSIRIEVEAYLDSKDQPALLMEKKDKAQKLLIAYLKWDTSNIQQGIRGHLKQLKQLEVEQSLDEYQSILMHILRRHDFDMPGKDDVTNILLRGRY